MQYKKALFAGQDDFYLAEFLIEKYYKVHGIRLRSSSFNIQRVDQIYQDSYIDNRNYVLRHGYSTDTSNLVHKLIDVRCISVLGWKAKTRLERGLLETYQSFISNAPELRS